MGSIPAILDARNVSLLLCQERSNEASLPALLCHDLRRAWGPCKPTKAQSVTNITKYVHTHTIYIHYTVISLISKEANKNKNKSEREIKVDISFILWDEDKDVNTYISKQRVVNNAFYKLICDGEVYNVGVKSCEKDGIIKFTYKNNNKIIYNPDYYMVNKTIKILNKGNIDILYIFQNQKMSTLAMEFLKNKFSSLPLSGMNESGDYIFNCDYTRNCQFNGCLSKLKTEKLVPMIIINIIHHD